MDPALGCLCHNTCVTCRVPAGMVTGCRMGMLAAAAPPPAAPSNPPTATLGLFPAEDLTGKHQTKPRAIPSAAEGLRCCPSAPSPRQSSSIPAWSETLPAPGLSPWPGSLRKPNTLCSGCWLLARAALVSQGSRAGLAPPALGTATAEGGSVSCHQHRLKINISDLV